MALIVLIFAMPFFYFYVVDNIQVEMMKSELKEVADYVANSLENLYLLVNSTSTECNVSKELSLPSVIKDSIYAIEIVGSGGNASGISAYLKSRSSVQADSWLIPGLKVGGSDYVESDNGRIVAGCRRQGVDVYAWIGSE